MFLFDILSIWASIWAPCWPQFPYFSHAFFCHRFCIHFGSNFHRFLGAQNHVLAYKYNGCVHFRLFRKSMKNHRFWCQIWPQFRAFWHQFSTLFRHRFPDVFSDAVFLIFYGKWCENGTGLRGCDPPSSCPGLPKKRSKNASATQPRFSIDFWSILGSMFGMMAPVLVIF